MKPLPLPSKSTAYPSQLPEVDRCGRHGAGAWTAGGLRSASEDGRYGQRRCPAPALEDEGEWKPYRCFRLYCSASCINYALVKDGQVVRVKTDDRNPDSEDMPQQRGCLRGQAKMNHVYGPDRLKYPMKRKNWEPGGDPAKINGELRGKDEWVRISWDEAAGHHR